MFLDIMQGRTPWKRIRIEETPDAVGKEDMFTTWQIYSNSELGENGTEYGNLCFDLDSKSLEEAIGEAKLLFDTLRLANVKKENIRLSFSGSKGFHIEIDYRSYMDKPEYKLHLIYKEIYNQLKPHFKTLDGSIYSSRRMWRMENSIHSKTNLYAIPLTRDDLELTAHEILIMSLKPRILERTYVRDEVMVEKLSGAKQNFYLKVNEFEKNQIRIKEYLKDVPPCISNALNIRGMTKNRNNMIYSLVCSMKGIIEEEEIYNRIRRFCENNNYSYDKDAVPTIRSALRKPDAYLSCSQFEYFCDKKRCEAMSNKELSEGEALVNSHFEIKTQPQAIADVKDKIKAGKYKRSISTGLTVLDRLTVVLNDHVTVIGANSNQGKSSFIATIIANNKKLRFNYLSIEEGVDRASMRLNKAEVFGDNIKVIGANGAAITTDLLIHLLKVHPCDALFIDQLINMDVRKQAEKERFKYKYMMEDFRVIARETNTPIFVLHQLGREALNRPEPRKEDLAEGADIERLAYDVWLLYRKEFAGVKYNMLKIDKTKSNKDGIIIPIKYAFDKNIFVDYDGLVSSDMAKELNIDTGMYYTGKAQDVFNIKEEGDHPPW